MPSVHLSLCHKDSVIHVGEVHDGRMRNLHVFEWRQMSLSLFEDTQDDSSSHSETKKASWLKEMGTDCWNMPALGFVAWKRTLFWHSDS